MSSAITNTRVLLLEDDRNLGATLAERLRKEGFTVNWSETISSLVLNELSRDFDLLILDIGLPDGNGLDVAKQVRAKGDIPVIFLTARSTAEDRLLAYEIGAEEFIPKPFHLRELFLRIQHVLANHARSQKVIVGDAVIDFAALSVTNDRGESSLSAREARVLKILLERSPNVEP